MDACNQQADKWPWSKVHGHLLFRSNQINSSSGTAMTTVPQALSPSPYSLAEQWTANQQLSFTRWALRARQNYRSSACLVLQQNSCWHCVHDSRMTVHRHHWFHCETPQLSTHSAAHHLPSTTCHSTICTMTWHDSGITREGGSCHGCSRQTGKKQLHQNI